MKNIMKGLFATAVVAASATVNAGYQINHSYWGGKVADIKYVEGRIENPDRDTFSVVHDEVAQEVNISVTEKYRDEETGEIIKDYSYSCQITPDTLANNGSGRPLYDEAVYLAENIHLFDSGFIYFFGGFPCRDLVNIEYRDWWKTQIFIHAETQSGQDMYIRGGIDHGYANSYLGRNCQSNNFECAIPIRHLNDRNATTAPWKLGDDHLDWYGSESGQSSSTQGTPLDWTTDYWPSSWGAKRTYEVDGFGETPLNTYGQHYWLLEVEMDCSATSDGWFEFKSYISNGPSWENDIQQPDAPWYSVNHFAKCGHKNVFLRNNNAPLVIDRY